MTTVADTADSERADYEQFLRRHGPRVQRALVAAYGAEIGVEAHAEAMAIAWERWSTVSAMANPAGYLYRVGQSHARPGIRWSSRRGEFHRHFEESLRADTALDADVLDVAAAVSTLSRSHRVAVLMVKAWGFTYAESAEVLGISEAALTNHVRRGLAALRRQLGVRR